MLLFLDIETSGLDAESSDLLELSAVRFDGEKVVATFDLLVHPEHSDFTISPFIQKLTGITPTLLREAPEISTVRTQFLSEFLTPEDIIVGHNISFDTGFLRTKGFVFANTEIDTYPLSTILLPHEESHSLEILTAKYELTHESKHRALSDSLANLELWKLLENIFQKEYSAETKAQYRTVLEKSNWTGKKFFLDLLNAEKEKAAPELTFSKDSSPKNQPLLRPEMTKTAAEKSFQTDVFAVFQERKKAVWEVLPSYPINPFFLAIEAVFDFAQREKKKVGISFHAYKEKTIRGLLPEFAACFSDVRCGFFTKPEYVLCAEKWQQFFQQESFSDLETIVALKVFREKSQRNYLAPNLKHEEWSVWDNLVQSAHTNCPVECPAKKYISENVWENFDVLFFPHKFLREFSGDFLLLDGVEHADEIFTRVQETVASSRRLRLLVANTPTAEKIDFLLGYFSAFLRKEVGESPYPVDIPLAVSFFHQKNWQELVVDFLETLQELTLRSAKSERLATECHAWQNILTAKNTPDFVRFCKLFPDDEVEVITAPIALENAVVDFFTRFQSTLCLGWPFPKTTTQNWRFSFTFPETVVQKRLSFAVPPRLREVSLPAHSGSEKSAAADMAAWLLELGAQNSGNIVAVFSSQKTAESVEEIFLGAEEVLPFSFFSHRSGSVGKLRYFLENTDEKKLLCGTPALLDKLFPLKNCSFSLVFFQKFIFDVPGSTLLSERKKRWQNAFEDFLVPRSVVRFEHEVYRLEEVQSEPYSFFCFDQRLAEENSLGKSFRAVLPLDIPLHLRKRSEIEGGELPPPSRPGQLPLFS